MSNLQTLNKVVDIAEKRRDEARAALAQQQRELQIAQRPAAAVADLRARKPTSAGWPAAAAPEWTRSSCSTSASSWHKIDHALEFQRGVIANREALIERSQGQLMVAERDVAGLRKYTERKLQAAQQIAQRQDQKATDEMALSIHLRQSLAQAQAQGMRT